MRSPSVGVESRHPPARGTTQQTATEHRERSDGANPELHLAIERAAAALADTQRADGSWGCDTDIGPVGLATQLLTEQLFGVDHRGQRVGIERYFERWQRPDGSFPQHPHATAGSTTTTALAWAALAACGMGDGAVAARARSSLDDGGGLGAVARAFHERGDVAALYLVAHGYLEASCLPTLPPALALAPLGALLDGRVHAGNVMTLLVIAALSDRHGAARDGGFLRAARRALECGRIRDYLGRWQNPDGSWNGSPLQTTLVLLGLNAAGATKADAAVQRALAWLETMKRSGEDRIDVCAMDNDVWSTALSALALHAAGEPADGPVLGAARAHLLATQSRRPMPVENQRKRGAARTGGWPFQRGNVTMPDTDDTGVVVAALAALAGERAAREIFRAIDDGVRWLRDMQNPDGGFPTFVWGLPSKQPGPMFVRDIPTRLDDPRALLSAFVRPPAEYGDPSLEGVTGRVLWGLGASGVTRDDPAVCRAIDFLREQQCESGAWWGRWKACYLAETATVLVGLAAVLEDMDAQYVRRALRWVLSRQNADGGFGELPEAYRDPQLAGRGPSMPPVTAYVLLGCLATRRAPDEAMHRAARYLLDAQDERGLWSNAGWLHTFVPPDLLYTYALPAHALPLLALAEYQRWSNA